MKSRLLVVACAALLGAAPLAAQDLGHPTFASFLASNVGDGERGVLFDALSSFSITSAGIKIDPLAGGPTGIALDIYSHDGAGLGTLGALLFTGSTAITDNGLDFYDITANFNFNAGSRYYLGFRDANVPWGFDRVNMEFYNFEASLHASYTVGDLRVLDGCAYSAGSCPNSVMPHIRLASASVVPEPASALLMMTGVAGLAVMVRRRNLHA